MSDYSVVETDGFRIESNSRTAEQMTEAFKTAKEAPEKAHKAAEKAVPQDDGAGDDPEGEESPETAPEGSAEAEKPLGKPRHDMKARMLEATRKESEAKKRADEIERRAIALEAELRALKSGIQPKAEAKPAEKQAPVGDGRPKLEDFESLEDHAEAVANWVADKREKAAKESQQKAEFERVTQEKFSSFAQRMGEHLKDDPDFWERQNETVVQLKPFSVLTEEEKQTAGPLNALADHFLVSDKAPALIEYFSGKPDELQRLSTLHPGNFWRELGRIEERLSAATTASAPPPVSKAAPPARPVTGGPPSNTSDPSKMTFEEFAKWQAAEDKKARKRG